VLHLSDALKCACQLLCGVLLLLLLLLLLLAASLRLLLTTFGHRISYPTLTNHLLLSSYTRPAWKLDAVPPIYMVHARTRMPQNRFSVPLVIPPAETDI
jgi:hypothetical protein